MSKTKIVKLILNDKKSNRHIFKKIDRWFSRKPGLMNIRFNSNSGVTGLSLFEYLLENNRESVVLMLIDAEKLWLTLLHKDSEMQNLIHYLVKKEQDNSRLLSTILRHCPGLLNEPTKNGDTALHLAVRAGHVWAIKVLAMHEKISLLQKNNDGKTVFDLAAGNRVLLSALVSKELNHAGSQSLGACNLSLPSTRAEIKRDFSKFCSPALKSNVLPVALENSDMWTWQELLKLKKRNSPQFEDQYGSLDEPSCNFLDLIKYYTKSSSAEYLKYLSQFIHKVKQTSLSQSQLGSVILHNEGSEEVLLGLLYVLQPIVEEESRRLYERHFQLIQDSLQQIIIDGFLQKHTKGEIPVFPGLDADRLELLKGLWVITEMEDLISENGHFLIEKLNQRILGLQQEYTFEEILAGLRLLYPKLNGRQKMLSQYINWQLIYYNASIGNLPQNPSFQQELDSFTQCSLQFSEGMGIVLNKTSNEVANLHNSPLFRNYRQLVAWLNHPEIPKKRISFDKLVDSALKKKPAERGAEVELVAHELRTLTREFYRRVSPQEFSHCNWTKKEASSKSSTIVQYTDYFNKLNDYFIQKILTQKSRDVSNALQLLLQIAQSLCNFEGEQEADLHHLMLMASILNSHRIMRLKQEYMSPADQEICDELDELVSGAGNFNRLRQVTNAFDSSLPFFPGILTDITMGIEGNPELVPKAEQLGAVLIKVFQKKYKNQFKLHNFRTDITALLGDYQLSNEEELSHESYMLYPKNEVLDLSVINFETITPILERLNEKFLAEGLLPKIKLGKNFYFPEQCLKKILSAFQKWVKSIPSLSEEQYQLLQKTVFALKESISRALEIYNNSYVKKMEYPQLADNQYDNYFQTFSLHMERIKGSALNKGALDSPRAALNKLKTQLLFFGSSRSMPGEESPRRPQSLKQAESGSALQKEARCKSTPPVLDGISVGEMTASLTPIEETIFMSVIGKPPL